MSDDIEVRVQARSTSKPQPSALSGRAGSGSMLLTSTVIGFQRRFPGSGSRVEPGEPVWRMLRLAACRT
jgi:hypothetical protein